MRQVRRFHSRAKRENDSILTRINDRYFETDASLQSHWRSKVHKRRLKQLREPAYTIEEAELAAGLGRDTRRATSSAAAVTLDLSMET